MHGAGTANEPARALHGGHLSKNEARAGIPNAERRQDQAMTESTLPEKGSLPRSIARTSRRRDKLGRVGFTIAEAARALGTRPDALRRLVERHARAEGDETIARLTGGIVARKRNGLGRWLVIIPAELRA